MEGFAGIQCLQWRSRGVIGTQWVPAKDNNYHNSATADTSLQAYRPNTFMFLHSPSTLAQYFPFPTASYACIAVQYA